MTPEPEKIIVECPRCRQALSIPGDRHKLQLTCPKCRATWLWSRPQIDVDVSMVAAYRRLIKSLTDCGFLFNANDFSEEKRRADSESTTQSIQRVWNLCKAAEHLVIPVIGASIPHGPLSYMFKVAPEIEFDFNSEVFQTFLDAVRSYADLVCFRYVLAQPYIVAVAIADKLSESQQQTAFEQFDSAMLACQSFTATIRMPFATNVKQGAYGIILWCFNNASYAQSFITARKEHLRKAHFFKKVYTVSWCVDLVNNTLTKHNSWPFVTDRVLDSKRFVRGLSDRS